MGEIVRLQKYIAMCGAASRRGAEELIEKGRVKVNGKTVREMGVKVEIGADKVELSGELLHYNDKNYYIMLNKPAGFVSTVRDQFERPTVIDLIKEDISARIFPVGRLDYETEGLLLFTNDGDLAHRLISPKHGIEKTYYAEHAGEIDETDIAAFSAGCVLRDGTVCRPAVLEKLAAGKCIVRVCEGKYHQVRRMLASRGKPVSYLRRIAEGGVELGDLPVCMTRELTETEIAALESVDFDEKILRNN